jgi:multimeric flavodoxin WrbA
MRLSILGITGSPVKEGNVELLLKNMLDSVQGAADILVLASPVYFMRTSARMAALLDRMRVFVFGNIAGGKLKNKIGVSAAVAWARHGGLETTHLTHLYFFLTTEMLPVSVHHCISPLGASALASENGMGLFNKEIRHGAARDAAGIHSGAAMMKRAVELAALIKKGGMGE